MKTDDFYVCSMIIFAIIARTTGSRLVAAAGILNALLVLYYVAERIWIIYHERD